MRQSCHTPKIKTLTIIADDDDMALKSDLMVLNTEAAVQNVSLFLRRCGSLTFVVFKPQKNLGEIFALFGAEEVWR